MKQSIILACVMIAALCFGCRSTRMWERDAAGRQIINHWLPVTTGESGVFWYMDTTGRKYYVESSHNITGRKYDILWRKTGDFFRTREEELEVCYGQPYLSNGNACIAYSFSCMVLVDNREQRIVEKRIWHIPRGKIPSNLVAAAWKSALASIDKVKPNFQHEERYSLYNIRVHFGNHLNTKLWD